MKHVVQFSTGAGSAEVAYRVVAEHGAENTVLLTADTLVEDPDNWRFAAEVVNALGAQWIKLVDGRTPMQVGRDHSCVPSNRLAVCSRVLKREILRRYIDKHYPAKDSIIYLGFDWTEPKRMEEAAPHWAPYDVRSPLMDKPYTPKPDLLDLFRNVRGIEPPRLYAQGFQHANCSGACVRGGQAQWQLLLTVNPRLYREWEDEEQTSRAKLGKDVSILRDRTTSAVKAARASGRIKADANLVPLTLRSFRERLEDTPQMFDADDWGACGCTDAFAGEDTTNIADLGTDQRNAVFVWDGTEFIEQIEVAA